MTQTTIVQWASAVLFALALAHTFSTPYFERLSHRFPRHAGAFHLLGEVEVVFGVWAAALIALMALLTTPAEAIAYVETRQFTEPLFVFTVMVIAASRPVLDTVVDVVARASALVPRARDLAAVWLALAIVPLTGSLITEPAAMTIAALLLRQRVFRRDMPRRVRYLALGVLFVNVSIGGTLTSYAAPPVLMVAATWQWDSAFMAATFGWKAALAVLVNASIAAALLARMPITADAVDERPPVPWHVRLIHLGFLGATVVFAHHPVIFIGLFLFFLGYTQAYEKHQSPLILREGLLVAFFLAGLVVLGGMQQWWLQPLVSGAEPGVLFFGALVLTAFTDNAALTYLGSQIEGITPLAQYMLVAGAVAGGGMTVIANAPNPAGAALLRGGFENGVIGAGGLALGALLPTLIAAAAFLVF